MAHEEQATKVLACVCVCVCRWMILCENGGDGIGGHGKKGTLIASL
jgi:hypothetical protein